MNAASIFSLGNSCILIGWILLIFLPNWKYTQVSILNGLIVLYSVVYAYLILKDIGDFRADSFSTLANVKALFQNDNAVAAGWFHYLAFDLFVGAYIVRKSISLGISRWLYTLALPFTFMFGPMGYLIFFIIKSLKTKSLSE
ncbi:MAG TPA: ABA4-like family protein [Leadbetterella sp.]|nr:ABA4-like family protein [Leadbetterella sp.]